MAFGLGAGALSGAAIAAADGVSAGSADSAAASDPAGAPAPAPRPPRARPAVRSGPGKDDSGAWSSRKDDSGAWSSRKDDSGAWSSRKDDSGAWSSRKARPARLPAAGPGSRPAASAVPARARSPLATALRTLATGQPPSAAPSVPAGAAVLPALSPSVALPRTATARPAPAAAITSSDSRAAAAPPSEIVALVAAGVLQIAVSAGMSVLNYAPWSPLSAPPTLAFNGVNLVPNAPETVISHYGRWSYFPGGLSMVQGQQRFDVVDPATNDTTGTVDALVTRGLGFNYQQLLVKSSAGSDVGAGAGQIPPAGSLVSTFNVGGFGLTYSSMPTASGARVSIAVRTPAGEVSRPFSFDAAKGFADRSVDNRPMNLGNGYRIAPVDPAGETIISTTGFPGFFGTVQGLQAFGVYDSEGNAVGSFDGVFTTTSDLTGTYTQAVLVTATDGSNVGTGAGQTPPVGSVYNIIYRGDDQHFFIYSSLPSPDGDVVSIVQGTPDGFTDITPTFINASRSPAVGPISTPQGYTFVPASELVPIGVNGLPPREVQIQGYQQFDVYDAAGNRLGRVDADVTNQWDMFGTYSQAILVTDASADSGGLPPAGSVFNFVQYGASGRLTTAHSTVPTPTADVSSFTIHTRSRDIDFPVVSKPAAERADVILFSPFRAV